MAHFQKFVGQRGNIKEHVVRFLDCMDAFPHDDDLSMREFFKFLTNRAYTWYVNLKPGSLHHWEHLVSLFNTKFLYAEAKFSIA